MNQTDFTGKHLGGYRILRKLGQGGMAVVYKAHEESLNRVVALKVIGEHLSGDPQFIERFKREAQAAAQLSHPNIVQIYAIGEDQGVHYFSMEYIKGRSLAEIVEEEGFLTAGKAVPIIAQAAEALAVAHDAGIVHRDIKPPNIMLDEVGRAKVADFGIAQMATASRMTQSGMLVGTPEYISPEQCRGEKLDGRSDIYALGVTLYHVLTGRTPFEADTPAALVLQIVEGGFPAVGQLNPTIPADVQAIVGKMVHTDRNARFQSAEDLVHALKKADIRPTTKEIRLQVPPSAAPTAPVPTEVAPPPGAATEAMPTPPAATEAAPRPPVATAAKTTPAATEAMPAPPAATVALPPRPTAAETAPAAATKITPAAPSDGAAAQPAAPPPPPPASGRASPATQAYSGSSQQRKPLYIAAAAVVAIIVLAFLAWQFLPISGDEATGTVAATDPAAGSEPAAEEPEGGEGGANTAAGEDDTTGGEVSEQPEEESSGGGTTDQPTGGGEAVDANAAAEPPVSTQAGAEQTTTSAATQAQPPPATPPAEAEVAFVPPPVNSIVAATSGEYEYVDLVGAWIEGIFAGQDFEVVDYPASPYGSMPEAARFLVATTATLVSARQLEYFGNVQTQYTVGLTMRVTDLADGVTIAGPATTTIQYTAINMQENLEKGTSDLARRLAREVRQLIR